LSNGRRRRTKMMSFRKHKKAVSPILSVLLMIAVAVAAALVTYAWVMGYLGFTTSKVGKAITIQSIGNDTAKGDLKVYVQNVGDSAVTMPAFVYVDGIKLTDATATSGASLAAGQTISYTIAGRLNSTYVTSLPYTIKVKAVTEDGAFSGELIKTFE
jgi:flagellin-like protein